VPICRGAARRRRLETERAWMDGGREMKIGGGEGARSREKKQGTTSPPLHSHETTAAAAAAARESENDGARMSGPFYRSGRAIHAVPPRAGPRGRALVATAAAARGNEIRCRLGFFVAPRGISSRPASLGDGAAPRGGIMYPMPDCRVSISTTTTGLSRLELHADSTGLRI
jgi:hypothetical protein